MSNNEMIRRKVETSPESASIISQLNLIYSFATVGTGSMLLKIALSALGHTAKGSFKNTLKILEDFALRIREIAQYSIYAKPSSSEDLLQPDDVAMDFVNNIDSALLGRTVYNFNAFMSPWLGIFKAFFPYSHGILGLATRVVQAADDVNFSITNMFWNLRKMVWSLVPYDGRVRSTELREKQSQMSEIYYFLQNRIISVIKDVAKNIFKLNSNHNYSEILYEQENQRIKTTLKNLSEGYINKWRTLFSNEYIEDSPFGQVVKKVGQEEPYNSPLFVRTKIFSQLISLPVGLLSLSLNSLGACINVIGNVFDDQFSKRIYTKLSKYALGLQSLLYITGEVPANINEFFRKQKAKDPNGEGNLVCAAVGFAGMLNNIKVLPIFSTILKTIKLKPYLDFFEKELDNLFYLFFSLNRYVLHSSQKEELLNSASEQDISKVKKFDSFWKFFILPFRVMLRDRDVCNLKEKELYALTSETNSPTAA